MEEKKGYILSPIVNLLLFDMLLVATPFLMLQNYLQQFVKELSTFSIDFLGLSIPIIFTMFLLFLLSLIVIFYKKITIKAVIVLLTAIFMMIIGQKIADYYINYKFYDLQNNWHYFAYGIFVFVMYRYLLTKKISHSKILLIIFSKALLISAFDEGIQVFISNRIFDISDIAKDMWGVVMGLMILLFLYKNYSISPKNWIIRQKHLKDYLDSPISIFIYLCLASYIFLFISSILTADIYWYMIFVITIFIFSIIFFSIHISRIKILKYLILGIYTIFLLSLVLNFLSHDRDNLIKSQANHLISYKGLPIPYFDVMVYPSGTFRLVDKKTSFKGGDFITFFSQGADILLIASGRNGEGGKGFQGGRFWEYPYFIFNTVTEKPIQVIILKNETAFKEYSRLIKENKKVLLVVHNS